MEAVCLGNSAQRLQSLFMLSACCAEPQGPASTLSHDTLISSRSLSLCISSHWCVLILSIILLIRRWCIAENLTNVYQRRFNTQGTRVEREVNSEHIIASFTSMISLVTAICMYPPTVFRHLYVLHLISVYHLYADGFHAVFVNSPRGNIYNNSHSSSMVRGRCIDWFVY